MDKETLRPLLEDLGPNVETLETEHFDYKDGLAVEKWLARHTGLEPVLPDVQPKIEYSGLRYLTAGRVGYWEFE